MRPAGMGMYDPEEAHIDYLVRKPYYRTYYERHKERLKLEGQEYRRTHYNYRLWYKAKARAKKYGLPFTITKEDIVIPEYCPVFGMRLTYSEGPMSESTATLDRIIPDLGYVKGNIAVISWKANEIKFNHTFDELQKIVQWMSTFPIVQNS